MDGYSLGRAIAGSIAALVIAAFLIGLVVAVGGGWLVGWLSSHMAIVWR